MVAAGFEGDFMQQTLPASNVAAITLNNEPNLRVYLQDGTKYTAVPEFCWEGQWSACEPVLPPASN